MGSAFQITGSTRRTQQFLNAMTKPRVYPELASLAQRGVDALVAATPKDSGLTAASWGYEIEMQSGGGCRITWTNTNTIDGTNIALILQTGHGTGTGGYVAGRDYINPALKPIFDEIANRVWKTVTSA